jgi:hypothetical protein
MVGLRPQRCLPLLFALGWAPLALPGIGAVSKSGGNDVAAQGRRCTSAASCMMLRGGCGVSKGEGIDDNVGRVSIPSRRRKPGVSEGTMSALKGRPRKAKHKEMTAIEKSVLQRYRQSLADDSLTRTVYVGRLPYNVTEDELWSFFVTATDGNHSRVDVPWTADPAGAVRIPRNASGWGKGFAFVTLPSSELLQRALELDGTLWRGRKVVVAMSKKPDACDTLFVGNLDAAFTPQDVESFLSDKVAGPILAIRASSAAPAQNVCDTAHAGPGTQVDDAKEAQRAREREHTDTDAGTHTHRARGRALGWFVQLLNSSCVDETVRRLKDLELAGVSVCLCVLACRDRDRDRCVLA